MRTRGRFRAADSAALLRPRGRPERPICRRAVRAVRASRSRPPRHRSPWRPAASIHPRISTSGRARAAHHGSTNRKSTEASRAASGGAKPHAIRRRAAESDRRVFRRSARWTTVAHAQPRARGPMECRRACGRSSRHPRRSPPSSETPVRRASRALRTAERTGSESAVPGHRRPAHPGSRASVRARRALRRRLAARGSSPARTRAGLLAAPARSTRHTRGSTSRNCRARSASRCRAGKRQAFARCGDRTPRARRESLQRPARRGRGRTPLRGPRSSRHRRTKRRPVPRS